MTLEARQEWMEHYQRLYELKRRIEAEIYPDRDPELMAEYRRLRSVVKRLRRDLTYYGGLHWMKDAAPSATTAVERMFARGLTVAALDTEYFQRDGMVIPTEVGLAVHHGQGQVYAYHWRFKGSSGKPFLHGNSQYSHSWAQLRESMWSVMRHVDAFLVWTGRNDIRALQTTGISLPEEKVVEMSMWQMGVNPDGSERAYSLHEFCDLQCTVHVGAHCAGNDAYSLMNAVLHGVGVRGPECEMELVDAGL